MSWVFQGGTYIDQDGKPKPKKEGKKEHPVPAMLYFRKLCLDSADFWISRWQDYYHNYLRYAEKMAFGPKKPGQYDGLFEELQDGVGKSDKIVGRRNLITYAVTAEFQEIRGFVQENFLLDFTLMSCLPCRVAVSEWNSKEKKWKLRWPFTAIVIPEPSDLRSFATRFADDLRQLDGHELEKFVLLPQEAALVFLSSFIHEDVSSIARYLNWVHVICLGRNSYGRECESVERVLVDPIVIRQYKNFRKELWCPPVRREVLMSLLNGEPWYSRLGPLLEKSPTEACQGPFAHDMRFLRKKLA
jgi:CRISPR-associated protein Cmx8